MSAQQRRERVLVTGGTGLVGGALLRALLADDVPVTALARRQKGVDDLTRLGARAVLGDLSDGPHLDDALDGAHRVIHLAARAQDTGSAEAFTADNVDAAARLARRAARAGVRRFVHASSISVYGFASLGDIDEDEPTPPIAGYPYAESKRLAEEELRRAVQGDGTPDSADHNSADDNSADDNSADDNSADDNSADDDSADDDSTGGMQLVLARLGSVYGPASHHWTVRPARLLTRGPLGIPLLQSGTGVQNPIYLDDVVDGLRTLSTHEAVTGGAFFVTDEAVSYRAFFEGYARALGVPFRHRNVPRGPALVLVGLGEAVARLRGRTPELTRIALRVLCRRTTFRNDKLARVTGFSPKVSLEDGQARCAAWLRDHGGL